MQPTTPPARDEVQLWCWRLDAAADASADAAILSPAERARAERFLLAPHRLAFLRAHAGLRRVLGALLGRPPAALDFTADANGKPLLAGAAAAMHFNLSHSHGLAALGVARFPLGVDIEALRPIAGDLADRYFSPRECRALAALPRARREAGFFNAWTRKEAYLKAIGSGLAAPLDGFAVSLAPGASAELLEVVGQPDEAALWQLAHVELPPAHVGAVAARQRGWRFVLHDAAPLLERPLFERR